MKKIQLLVSVVAVVLMVASCSKTDSHEMKDKMQTGSTKIVVIDNVQVAFDIMDTAAYEKMMTMMKMTKKDNVEQYLSIALMDKSKKKPIKNAKVSVTLEGPNNFSKELKAMGMEGGGMYHYGSVLDIKEKGKYKISAKINIDGKDIEAKTNFKI